MGTGAAHFMANSGTTLQGREKERKRGTPKLLPLAYKCLALSLRLVHYYATRKPIPATSKHGSIKFLFLKFLQNCHFRGRDIWTSLFTFSFSSLVYLLQHTSPHFIYNKIFIAESYLERINFGDLLSRRDNWGLGKAYWGQHVPALCFTQHSRGASIQMASREQQGRMGFALLDWLLNVSHPRLYNTSTRRLRKLVFPSQDQSEEKCPPRI